MYDTYVPVNSKIRGSKRGLKILKKTRGNRRLQWPSSCVPFSAQQCTGIILRLDDYNLPVFWYDGMRHVPPTAGEEPWPILVALIECNRHLRNFVFGRNLGPVRHRLSSRRLYDPPTNRACGRGRETP